MAPLYKQHGGKGKARSLIWMGDTGTYARQPRETVTALALQHGYSSSYVPYARFLPGYPIDKAEPFSTLQNTTVGARCAAL
jgi:hypothetical protein